MFVLQVQTKVPEVTDSSRLSQQPIKNSIQSQGADPNRNRPPAPVSQPAATLAGVQSQYTVTPYTCVYAGSIRPPHRRYALLNQVCLCTGERVEGLRRVLIPKGLTQSFLSLARSNTARGIETCGVLCGQLVSETHVLSRPRPFSVIYHQPSPASLSFSDAQRVHADSRRSPQTDRRPGFLRHGERGGAVQLPGRASPADAGLDPRKHAS